MPVELGFMPTPRIAELDERLINYLDVNFRRIQQFLSTAGIAPAGSSTPYWGATAPIGWLLCRGQSVAVADFPALFAAIGYTYGGSGANFSVPNASGRTLVGLNTADTDWDVLGETRGVKTHALTLAELAIHNHVQDTHNHVQNPHDHFHTHGAKTVTSANDSPNHDHDYFLAQFTDVVVQSGSGNGSMWGGAKTATATSGVDVNHQHSVTHTHDADDTDATSTNQTIIAVNQIAGSGTAHQNIQPSIVCNYIIKT